MTIQACELNLRICQHVFPVFTTSVPIVEGGTNDFMTLMSNGKGFEHDKSSDSWVEETKGEVDLEGSGAGNKKRDKSVKKSKRKRRKKSESLVIEGGEVIGGENQHRTRRMF